jgi:hypothetical protein
MDISNLTVNVAVAVLSGLAASTGFWFWTARLKHPSIRICPTLTYEQEGRHQSSVTLINRGKRTAADISIIAEIWLKGASSKTGRFIDIYLRIREERLPYLRSCQSESSDIGWSYRDSFKHDLPNKLRQSLLSEGSDLNLHEFIECAEKSGLHAAVQVYVIANDAVYGARSFPMWQFDSRDFKKGDWKRGQRCTLLTASGPNPECCQFASSRSDWIRHRRFYREISKEATAQER